ncbi:uncharacterized protein LOC116806303 [Drosophila grimshawi]|uniref:uncharacterized protein LOC116806303 n=1 Tax=Drosophila grimshawi TaxID=7222 RepID=UPI0013EF3594|nr:uncharacterized protein LOC116806303 [Drosophila grimshawi]
MLISQQYAGGYNINLIACWLLLLLYPVKVSSGLNNCTFIDGHILEFVCHGWFDRQLYLLYKDRHPALNTPYSIWQRADYIGSSMLLIVFYESPLTNCYNLVYSEGDFYCNGRNYPMDLQGTFRVNCLPFQFTYSDELHKKCHKIKKGRSAETISSVIVYMESNLIMQSRSTNNHFCTNLLLVILLFLRLQF